MAPKTAKLLLSLLVAMLVSAGYALATEQVNCGVNEVKVCFTDGQCICKVRSVQMQDPVPDVSSCVDEDDTGECHDEYHETE